ncbi:MAG TPA: glycosyltransferase [Longimicrobiaceae bacterium]
MNTATEPIRVFHLIKSLGRGGAEMLLVETLRFADRNRFDYRYGYFLPWKDAMVPALREQGVDVTCFGARSSAAILLAARAVARHLERQGADVLHCHLPVAGVVGRLAGRMARIPVVYSEHNTQERYHHLTRRLNRSTWSWQAGVVAVSREVAESIRANIRSDVPVRVILNGVDVQRFRRECGNAESIRCELGIPAGAPVVGCVAVFRVQKRLRDWLEAAALLLERHPDLHFLLVGDGPLRDEVTSIVGARGLADRVHLPGLQEDVRPFLAVMDVYLMSSLFEGLPIALLEAMAMECAPVCTRVGGIPEVIRSGTNGLLTEPRQPQELARAASELLSSPELRMRLAREARRTVVEQFSMERMARQLEETYLDVLQRRANGR